ncbi:hypothetical protein PENSPDRAFT_25838 [Peniophora sp. CONT]|nr:hypothetical protein PENSPDRAFT_25838 [Peniophora sp. CONT]
MPSRLGGLLPSRSSSSHQVHSQSPLVGGGSFRDKHPTSSASYSSSSGSTALPARNDNDFAALWRDALDEFYRLTGEDIRDENSGLYEWLKGCSDYASVMESLEKQALAFRAYRQGSPSALKMRSALRSVVRVIINVIDVGSEAAASKAVPGGKAMFVAIAVLLRTVQGISARFDALVALLEKFGSFLERLDLRMNAPFEPVSRILAVKTLTEMLRTLAYAAQVMRHNRAKHFFDVLVGHGDDITDLTRRTEDLMREETRLSLAEVHKRMHNLSGSFVSALGRIEDNIAQLNEEMHTVSIGVNGALERLDNSGMHDLPRQFEAFVERYEEDRIDGGLESATQRD